MSASSSPTASPRRASATARLTDDGRLADPALAAGDRDDGADAGNGAAARRRRVAALGGEDDPRGLDAGHPSHGEFDRGMEALGNLLRQPVDDDDEPDAAVVLHDDAAGAAAGREVAPGGVGDTAQGFDDGISGWHG